LTTATAHYKFPRKHGDHVLPFSQAIRYPRDRRLPWAVLALCPATQAMRKPARKACWRMS